MEDRYDTTKPKLNLLSTSHNRAQLENGRTNMPSDPLSAFSLQLSNLKLPKRLQNNTDNPSNCGSSPSFISQGCNDRAYIHSNHSKRQHSVSPNPQASFRLSSFKPSDTHKSSAKISPGYSAQAIRKRHFDEGSLDQVYALLASKDQLQSEIDKLDDLHSHASRERDEYRSRLASMTSQLESLKAELLKTRISLKEKIAAHENERVAMTASLSEAKSELSVVSGDRERLREVHAQDRAENDQLRKKVEASKKGIAALRERCDGRDTDFTSLKKAHDRLCIEIDDAKKEGEESKKLADNALAALKPLIDCDATLRRASDTKTVLKELQDDLAASQRVTDLLRDKLYNQASLLVEARDRIRDLEEEKRGSLGELLQGRNEVTHKIDLIADVEIKLGELAEKVASRELETIDVLANSAALTTELEVLRKASEVNDLELAALRVIKEESISKLLASQDVINLREKEIVSLRAEVKALGESRAESRALLKETKKLLGEKEVELRAKDPNWDLEFRIKELDTQVASLTATLHTCQDTLKVRETEIQCKVCDVEKLDVELALSKNMTMKLQDDLEELRSKEASKYELLLAEFEQIRNVFRSQEHVLSESKVALKERLEVQSVSLFQAKEESSKLKEESAKLKEESSKLKEESSKLKTVLAVVQEQKASVDALVNLHIQRADLIENQLKETQATAVDLKSQLHKAKTELILAEEASIISEQTVSSTLHERVNDLEKMVKDLEQQNDELSRRSVDILTRYQQGNVNDIEKNFVAYIMKQTQDIHAQGVVTKDNELRRRETMIQTLQAKIINMEVTIARLIQEKENLKPVGLPVVKSVVNLNRWLPESLPVHSPEDGAPGQKFVTLTAADKVISTSTVTKTSPSAPVKSSDPKFSRLECSDDDDSEDEVPLSELSRLPSDDPHVGMKRRRPISVPVPDEEPIRSKRRTRESPPEATPAPPIPAPVNSSSSSVKKVPMTVVTATAKNRQKKRK